MTITSSSNSSVKGKVLAFIDEYKNIKKRGDFLKVRVDETQNLKKRLETDFSDYKDRSSRILKEERLFSNFEIIKTFIPVLDNLELGISTIFDKKYVEGFSLVKDQFYKVLTGVGVVVLDPLHEVFNPNLHEAITFLKDNSYKNENTVAKVLRKGFVLNKKLIRPASVVIVKNN